jgi:hypothetical protein
MLVEDYTVTWFTLLWSVFGGVAVAIFVGLYAGWINQYHKTTNRELKRMYAIAIIFCVGFEVGLPFIRT